MSSYYRMSGLVCRCWFGLLALNYAVWFLSQCFVLVVWVQVNTKRASASSTNQL